jgi:RNA polymerase sigma-70 factor (ECF subfamily)
MAKAMALRISGCPLLAEDIVQDSYLHALEAIEQHTRVANPKAWFRRIVVHAAIDALKLRGQSAEQEPDIDRLSAVPRGNVFVQSVLESLCPEHQVVLALAFGERLSHKEIAALLDIPMGTVASRIHAAKAAFRKEWGEGND